MFQASESVHSTYKGEIFTSKICCIKSCLPFRHSNQHQHYQYGFIYKQMLVNFTEFTKCCCLMWTTETQIFIFADIPDILGETSDVFCQFRKM